MKAVIKIPKAKQRNFETISAELQVLRRQQLESNQRFEILLAELRQLKIDSDLRFNEQQSEIRQILQRSFSQLDDAGDG